LLEHEKEQKRLHCFKPSLNDRSLALAQRKYKPNQYQQARGSIVSGANSNAGSPSKKGSAVLPYRQGVFVLDPAMPGNNNLFPV
jgi:hypothetical protein